MRKKATNKQKENSEVRNEESKRVKQGNRVSNKAKEAGNHERKSKKAIQQNVRTLPQLENVGKARVGVPKQGLTGIMAAFNNKKKKRRK